MPWEQCTLIASVVHGPIGPGDDDFPLVQGEIYWPMVIVYCIVLLMSQTVWSHLYDNIQG